MKIGFFAPSCIPVHANTLAERPLGGTETGLIRVADELHRRGHEVIVFTSHQTPAPSFPRYVPAELVHRFQPFDVLVLVKDWKGAFFRIEAQQYLYWTGDGFDQYVNFGLGDRRVARKIPIMLAASTWHADTLCARSGYPRDQVRIVGNGVHPPYFGGVEPRSRRRLIYSSAPYRGLELLLPLFPKWKQMFPDLELEIFAGLSVYDTNRPYQGPEVQNYQRLAQLFRQFPGVHLRGNVTQEQLAREYLKSSVFVYPNFIFETCCITALEAQAAGCPVVASATSALPETVGDGGIVIPGDPGSEAYMEKFFHAVVTLLRDDDLWKRYSENGMTRVNTQHTWAHVASRIEQAANDVLLAPNYSAEVR